MTKNEILNSDWAVRRSAAGSPNTPAEENQINRKCGFF